MTDRFSTTLKSSLVAVSGVTARRIATGPNSRTVLGTTKVVTGKARWTVEIRDKAAVVGVANPRLDVEKWLGADAHGWSFDGSDGQKCHGGQWSAYTRRRFEAGSSVVVELDTSPRSGATLRFFVNGQDCGVAFSRLSSAEGFFLGVSLKVGGSVQIRDFAVTGGAVPTPRASPVAPTSAGGEQDFWATNPIVNTDIHSRHNRQQLWRSGAASQSRTTLGEQVVASGIAEWQLLCGSSCIVGVAMAQASPAKWLGCDEHGWGMDGSDGQRCHSGAWRAGAAKFNAGDTIRVRLDLNTHTLQLDPGTGSFKVVFDHMPNGRYHLAAALRGGASVSIVAFSTRAGAAHPIARSPAQAAAADSWHPTRHSWLITVDGTIARRTGAGSNSRTALGRVGVSSGKCTWKLKIIDGPSIVGVSHAGGNLDTWCGGNGFGWGYDGSDGQKSHSGNWAPYFRRFSAGSIVSVTVDMDAHTLSFAVGNAHAGVAYRDLRGEVFVACSLGQHRSVELLSCTRNGPVAAVRTEPVFTGVPQAAAPAPSTGVEVDKWDRAKCSSLLTVGSTGHDVKRTLPGTNSRTVFGLLGVSSGVVEWDVEVSGPVILGVAERGVNVENYLGESTTGWGYDLSDGQKSHGRWAGFSSAMRSAGVVTVIVDMNAGTLRYRHQTGTMTGIAYSNLDGRTVHLAVALGTDRSARIVGTRVNGVSATNAGIGAAAATTAAGTAGAVAGAGGSGAGATTVAPPGNQHEANSGPKPLHFDPDRSYTGIEISGPRAVLRTSDTVRQHSRTAVSMLGYKSGRHAWSVEVHTGNVIVGCATASTSTETYLGAGAGYGYDGTDGQIAHKGAWAYYGCGFRPGHTVTVVVDCDVGSIEFLVGGVTQGIAGRDLPVGEEVFAAISLGNVGDSASLVPVDTLPSTSVVVSPMRRTSSLSPADTAKAAMDQLLAATIEAEYITALGRLNSIAATQPQLLSWRDLVSKIQTKRKAPHFAESEWTTTVAKCYGQLLRTVKAASG